MPENSEDQPEDDENPKDEGENNEGQYEYGEDQYSGIYPLQEEVSPPLFLLWMALQYSEEEGELIVEGVDRDFINSVLIEDVPERLLYDYQNTSMDSLLCLLSRGLEGRGQCDPLEGSGLHHEGA